MAAHPKFIRQKPLDIWTTHEKLMLSSSVLLSGDQNWVSVSRAIKNQSQENRPPEYFSQKNCALQYGELLEHAETPKRKKSEKNEVIPVETQGMIIVNKLRTKYMEELVTEIKQQQEAYLKLEDEIEMVNSGHCDGQLAEIWEQIQKKLRENDPEEVPPTTQTETVTETTSDTQTVTQSTGEPVVSTADTVSTSMEVEDTTAQDSPSQEPHIEVDDNPQDVPTITEEPTVPPLIIKVPEKSQRQPSATPTKTVTSERSEDQPTPKKSVSSPVKETPVIALETTKPKTRQHSGAGDGGSDKGTTPRTKPEAKLVAKLEPAPPAEPERVTPVPPEKPTSLTVTAETTSEIERSDSPVSTVSSVSEVTKKKIKTPTTSHQTPSSQTSGAASGSLRRSGRVVKTVAKEEKDKKEEVVTPKATPSVTKSASEVELSSDEEEKDQDEDEDDDDEEAEEEDDEEMEEEDDVASTSKHHDSAPDSPSVTHSDVEDDKYHKAWKKSIMLVWRQIAHHKFGNVFMDKVTDEIAPGYSLCINRPMSLSLIKQNIEKNVIRTTEEFTRDIMLMFVNAIMYNNHEYDVYVMAQEMYDAAMKSIEQHTQTMVKETEAKPISLRGRKSDVSLSSDKESDKSRRRSSAEQQLDSSHGSTGRRKTRADI